MRTALLALTALILAACAADIPRHVSVAEENPRFAACAVTAQSGWPADRDRRTDALVGCLTDAPTQVAARP